MDLLNYDARVKGQNKSGDILNFADKIDFGMELLWKQLQLPEFIRMNDESLFSLSEKSGNGIELYRDIYHDGVGTADILGNKILQYFMIKEKVILS